MKVRCKQRGSVLLENAMYLPILFVLLMGMMEIARITYTYYTVQKMLYTIGRYVGTQQGVNFCDDADATVVAAKNFALTGTSDGSGTPTINNFTVDRIQVRIERYSAVTGDIGQCECAATGCDTTNVGQGPDHIVISIPEGFPVLLAIPNLPIDPIVLRPRVRVPFQGT